MRDRDCPCHGSHVSLLDRACLLFGCITEHDLPSESPHVILGRSAGNPTVESNDNSIQFRNGFDPCVHRVQLLSKCIVQLVKEFGILAMDNEFQTPQILAAILKKAQTLRVSSASGEIDA
jgi:hypothetical protein